ncbi:Hypothetical protein SRAE_2000382950 [Strongyloides ratti]|uniref:Uncharacterized protein n=1 Tax=Strongyloides ratti TaxID=34506 RepID=A0A090MZM2_STRRB|nr:Hypothetical protein SRAE_2000382950 [Strongyloides ratti]CEF69179.1 Hypothetical protein SRAE_2000382950 [Strongyloides ratti]
MTFLYIIGTLLCFFGYIIGYNQKQEIVFNLYGYGIGGILLLDSILMNINKYLIKESQKLPRFYFDEVENIN